MCSREGQRTMNTRSTMHFGGLSLALAAAGAAQLFAASARAEQFVLIDSTFTFTKQQADANDSHYYGSVLNAARPADWTAPVDYRNGTVHIRAEILDKPAGGEITQWVLCYIAEEPIGPGYGCTGTGTYTEEGVYEVDVDMTSWWQNEAIDWTRGISEMHLVLKDEDDSTGFAHQREDVEHFFPTKVRITMIQVSEGSTYDPSQFPGGDGEPDAGSNHSDDDAGMDGGSDGSGDDSDDNDGSDDMTAGSGNGNGNGSGGSGNEEPTPEGASDELGGCSVGTMGTAASPHVGVMALGLSALIARARRRKRGPTS
jgi:hypothetical protein